MTITFPNCPEAVKDSLINSGEMSARVLPDLPAAGLKAGIVHEVYYIPPTDLVQQKSLANARRVAWRMTYIGANRAIAAEVDVSLRPDNTAVTSLNEGPFSMEPDGVLTALRQSKAGGSFELRILRIPEVYLMACWLHSQTLDLLVPLHPAPNGLLAGQEYSVQGLATALSSAVRALNQQHPDADS